MKTFDTVSRPSPLLTVADASEALGVSVSTVRRLIRYRYLGVIRVGRSIRISTNELIRFQADNTWEAL